MEASLIQQKSKREKISIQSHKVGKLWRHQIHAAEQTFSLRLNIGVYHVEEKQNCLLNVLKAWN